MKLLFRVQGLGFPEIRDTIFRGFGVEGLGFRAYSRKDPEHAHMIPLRFRKSMLAVRKIAVVNDSPHGSLVGL